MSGPTRGFDWWQRASKGNGRYSDPDTGKEIKFNPKEWEGGDYYAGTPRVSTGQVPATNDQAIKAGFKLVAMGIPCPIAGSENGTVYYEVDGERAIWDDGNVYMKGK